MAAIPIIIKHQGKKYDVDLDTEATGETLKFQLFSLTNVEPDRQKILIKGGQLKDDTPLSSLNAKKGQTFMMMGTPSGDAAGDIERPAEKVKFIEDMTEAEAAQQEGATPAGLQNLGNTCYLNSALQTLKAIPELNDALSKYKDTQTPAPDSRVFTDLNINGGTGGTDLTSSLRDVYKMMADTQSGFPPIGFLYALRQSFPQFAQKAKDGRGFAQQDAEEVWSSIVQTLRTKLKLPEGEAQSAPRGNNWVDKYLAGTFDQVMTCDDSEAQEESTKSQDVFFKLDCNIRGETNHMREGIAIALNETMEKQSPSLNREATYTKSSRISRLPKYLPVHFVRFFWRRDTQKKAKIMRKVTFPMEFDIVEFCSDDLKKQLIPVRDHVRELRKEVEDVERAKKRQKRMRKEQADNAQISSEPLAKKKEKEQERETKAAEPAAASGSKNGKSVGTDVEMGGTETFKTDAEIDAERAVKILAAKQELLAAVDPALAADDAANQTGLYELRGVVTHQGGSADSGHYTAYIKKSPKKRPDGTFTEEDGKWWWFNDDRVSEVDAEKIETLCGGGESHSALILLYRAVPLPLKEDLDAEEKILSEKKA